jgi:hypothetical protein
MAEYQIGQAEGIGKTPVRCGISTRLTTAWGQVRVVSAAHAITGVTGTKHFVPGGDLPWAPGVSGSRLQTAHLRRDIAPAYRPERAKARLRMQNPALANYATATLLASSKGLGCSLDIVAWLTSQADLARLGLQLVWNRFVRLLSRRQWARFAQFSGSDALCRMHWSADFIPNTSESELLAHTEQTRC